MPGPTIIERPQVELGDHEVEAPRLRGRLAVHLAAYAMILMVLAPFMHLNTAWSVDEGDAVIQVRALQQGDWSLDYWAESFDPDGRWFPLQNVLGGAQGFLPYAKSPTYPLLMRAATAAVGDFGLHLLPLLGALGAAAAAWLLAAQVDRRSAPLAFWIAAVGPVVINAYAVWAHAPSAAVAGLTAYAAIRALRAGISAPRLAGLCVGVAFCVLLRTEGFLFAAAVTAVLGALGGIRILTRAPGAVRAIWLAAAAGASALSVNVLEHQWVTAITGRFFADETIVGHFATRDTLSFGYVPYWQGRLQGARHVLWSESHLYTSNANLKVAVVAALVAGLALRRGSRRAHVIAAVAIFAASAALLVQLVRVPLDTVPGLIPAWPIAVFGLLFFSWRSATLVERSLAGIVFLALLATLATQYVIGGGFEWGARYLSPLSSLIAALAALALYRLLQRSPTRARRHLVGFLVLLALVPAASGLVSQAGLRAKADRWIRVVESGPGVVITSNQWRAQGAYRTFPDHKWLHVPLSEIPVALNRLGEAGYDNVTVLEPLHDWSTESSDLSGGYRVQRDLESAVYLTRP